MIDLATAGGTAKGNTSPVTAKGNTSPDTAQGNTSPALEQLVTQKTLVIPDPLAKVTTFLSFSKLIFFHFFGKCRHITVGVCARVKALLFI